MRSEGEASRLIFSLESVSLLPLGITINFRLFFTLLGFHWKAALEIDSFPLINRERFPFFRVRTGQS